MIFSKHIGVFIIMLCLCFAANNAFAQTDSIQHINAKIAKQEDIKLYFRINSYTFEPKFSDNEKELSKLDSMINHKYAMIGLDSLDVEATASVDGPELSNAILAERRSKAMKRVLEKRYPKLDKDLITTNFTPEDWKGFREVVAADENLPYKDEVLSIIDSDKKPDTKERIIKTMHKKQVWDYMKIHTLPKLRYSSFIVFYYNIEREKLVMMEMLKDEIETIVRDSIWYTPDSISVQNLIDSTQVVDTLLYPIALKSNLLYDASLSANLELEIPIGKKFSVGAEVIYPWWSSNKNNYTQRLRHAHLSFTYWLGDREKWDYLTGWNIGVFGGYGDYDMQPWKQTGIQGDIINTGISFGYAHSINKKGNLHLHYQFGLGYMQSDYRNYTKYWDTRYGDVKVFDYPWIIKRQTWVGPTQAEVSLVWMINFKKESRQKQNNE